MSDTPTVLLVEDDPSIQKGLEMNLKVDGLRVLCASDGVAAVRAARTKASSIPRTSRSSITRSFRCPVPRKSP
jgi:CheY-like chemotaxis protein